MKKYGLYLWVNRDNKIYTITNREDDVLILLTVDDGIKEYHFNNTNSRDNFEKQLIDDGYVYNNLGDFLIAC